MATMSMPMFVCYRIVRINHFKMRHHTCCMVLQNMAMVHPSSGTIIGHPGNLYLAFWFQVVSIFPCFVGRGLPILFQYLEEEAMQMKWMVHQAGIRYFPYLQVANHDRPIIAVCFIIYQEVNTVFKTWSYG